MTDRKRIAIYIAFAFGIAWLGALVIALRGGLSGSRVLSEETGLTEAFVIVATVYMFAPAMAHLLTRIVTREGWQGLHLRMNIRAEGRIWLIVWIAIPLLILAGAALYFTLFPQYFDGGTAQFVETLETYAAQTGQPPPFSPEVFLLISTLQALIAAPIINAIPILGEEFGWRAYLQPKLLAQTSPRRAMLWMGLIWGVWHWPLIAMGHSFGLDYPGAPFTGMLAFTVFTFSTGTILGWSVIRTGTVWPAVIGHGVLNGLANGVILFTAGEPNLLFGPLVSGLVAGLPLLASAVWLLFSKFFDPPVTAEATDAA